MNLNLISNILKYLEIDVANKYVNQFEDIQKEYIIKSFANLKNLSFKNMKAKFNNLDNRCGYCNSYLVGDYVLKVGLINCNNCDESKGLNIHLCNSCNETNLRRGQVDYKICMKGHRTIYYGINFLS